MKPLDLFEAAKRHPWVLRNALVQRLGRASMGVLQGVGVQTWGTKSFEFWTLLSAALWLVRPRSIVELGSGRSTQYLADYAMKESISFVSVEQSSRWARRVRRGLTAALVAGDFVHHVPVAPNGWYDRDRLDGLVRSPFEALFVDGPVGVQEGLGSATRDNAVAREWFARMTPAIRLLIIDDTHRQENQLLLDAIRRNAGGLIAFSLSYQPGRGANNMVVVAVRQQYAARLYDACAALGISIEASG
jgi:hypothetical protein